MPKYNGVRKMMRDGAMCARRWRGVRRERKTSSSVMGPWTGR